MLDQFSFSTYFKSRRLTRFYIIRRKTFSSVMNKKFIYTISLIFLLFLLLIGSIKYNGIGITRLQRNSFRMTRFKQKLASNSSLMTRKQPLSPSYILQLNSNASQHIAPPYKDKDFLQDCIPSWQRKELYKMMIWWMNFSSEHNITWFMTYGSLIGSQRHKDSVPWDHDGDIGVLLKDEKLLREVQTPRGKLHRNKYNLVCRPSVFCRWDSGTDRQSCSGRKVKNMVDECSFCGPLCRVVSLRPSMHLDLFLYKPQFHGNVSNSQVIDEGCSEYRKSDFYVPYSYIFPLKLCDFMGLRVLCPNDSDSYLKMYYKDWSSKYKCVAKKWIKL